MSDIPRRIDRARMTHAEVAITDAMYAVEGMPPSPLLTEAVTLLSRARDRVADYVDDVDRSKRAEDDTREVPL